MIVLNQDNLRGRLTAQKLLTWQYDHHEDRLKHLQDAKFVKEDVLTGSESHGNSKLC